MLTDDDDGGRLQWEMNLCEIIMNNEKAKNSYINAFGKRAIMENHTAKIHDVSGDSDGARPKCILW